MVSPILDLGPCNSSCARAIDSTDNFRTCATYGTTLAANSSLVHGHCNLHLQGARKGGGGGGGGGGSVASLTLRQFVWVCDKLILYGA